MIHGVGRREANSSIKTHSALRYACRVIACVNKEEKNPEEYKRKMTAATIKVSGLSHKRANKSDPRLAQEIFHKIYHMYGNINNTEEKNTALLLTSMSYYKYTNKVYQNNSKLHDNHQNEFTFQVRPIVPPELRQIQPRATQVWKFDEIGDLMH